MSACACARTCICVCTCACLRCGVLAERTCVVYARMCEHVLACDLMCVCVCVRVHARVCIFVCMHTGVHGLTKVFLCTSAGCFGPMSGPRISRMSPGGVADGKGLDLGAKQHSSDRTCHITRPRARQPLLGNARGTLALHLGCCFLCFVRASSYVCSQQQAKA